MTHDRFLILYTPDLIRTRIKSSNPKRTVLVERSLVYLDINMEFSPSKSGFKIVCRLSVVSPLMEWRLIYFTQIYDATYVLQTKSKYFRVNGQPLCNLRKKKIHTHFSFYNCTSQPYTLHLFIYFWKRYLISSLKNVFIWCKRNPLN